MNSFDAVIFDFDGTLADSMGFLESIGVDVMTRHYGVTFEDATQRYRTTTGLPYEHQIEVNFPGDPRNRAAVEEFERLKIERIYEQKLFPDTRPTLEALNRAGVLVFVSSSTFESTIREYFRRVSLVQLIRDVMGYRPGFEKGADHFRYVANTHRIRLERVVFVGDSLKDFERSRGFCRFIGLTGIFSEEDFRRAGHSGPVVHRLSETVPIITGTCSSSVLAS
ncbi:MAG: HAD hydrolase-like protein [Candidatus Thorarchaeota archaeon]